MSIWDRIGEFVARVTATAATGVADVVEAVRTIFEGDAELRRRVSFSIAMIALSAKMAKADGIVTQDEIRAFQQIFSVPTKETRNVARLYDLAQADVAGFEAYAERMARLCGSGRPNCAMLEDVLDGLFHIAKADGLLHEREGLYLHRVAQIFMIGEDHYQSILARHLDLGEADPYTVLGIERGKPCAEVRVSPNFGPRHGVSRPDMIVLHYTGMETGQAAEARLCDPASEVSSHYLVHEDGRIVQMVRESDRAWHAGKSSWRGATDINSRSIGIEIVNPGHEFGYPEFPKVQ